MSLALATGTLREPTDASELDGDGREMVADALVRIGSAGALFCDAMGTGYARIAVGGHCECWPLRSKGFHRWLVGAYYAESGRAPKGEAFRAGGGGLAWAASPSATRRRARNTYYYCTEP